MMAGKPSPSPYYHLHLMRIIQPEHPQTGHLDIKKPRAGDRGFLCSFLDRLLGGWESLSTIQLTFGGANRS
jgi:hypothetical protein